MQAIRIALIGAATACAALLAESAYAGGHSWKISEVFSTADGLIQFIEVTEPAGLDSELGFGGISSSSHTAPAPSPRITFPTGHRSVLYATASFAALPGAPTPDVIIPASFFSPAGDTVTYSAYDSYSFGPVPTDCVRSLQRSSRGVVTTGPNSPTNYSHQSGSGIYACPGCLGDCAPNGVVNVSDLLLVIGAWGQTSGPADINNDGIVNVSDLLLVIGHWGNCT